MNLYNEIGGYLGLECSTSEAYHKGIYLNSARNALRYIVRVKGIKHIFLPYFTCPVIWDALKEEGCQLEFYDIDRNLNPILDKIPRTAYIVCNNYFGIQTDLMRRLAVEYENIIIDNAQAFYAPQLGLGSFYSPRKFFGLPDGGIVLLNDDVHLELEQDQLSYTRCEHLLKRYDLGANASYSDFIKNDASLINENVMHMSTLTSVLMKNIDYEYVKKKRRENYLYLHNQLSDMNLLSIKLTNDDVPLAYPLLIEAEGMRDYLISHKIYIPKYWPNIDEYASNESNAIYMVDNLISIPIDQRYGINDMQRIAHILKKY